MATQGRTMSRLELMGLVPLVPVMGLKALGHAVAASAPATLCANSPAYWPALLRLLPKRPGFYSRLADAHRVGQAPGAAGGVGRAVGATVDSGASAVDVEAVRQQLQRVRLRAFRFLDLGAGLHQLRLLAFAAQL